MPSSKQMAKAIKDDLLRYLIGIQAQLDESVASRIGNAVVAAMLDSIEKGISPIEGAGRFPAYLSTSRGKATRQQLRTIGRSAKASARQNVSQARFLKLTKVFRSRNNLRAMKANLKSRKASLRTGTAMARKNLKAQLAASQKGYPYNTSEYRKGQKKPRPVNLFLTGEFLAALEYVVTGRAGALGLEIGFFDEEQAIKEQGHREGAGGQPKRPIIPIGREDFAVRIQRAIIEIVDEVLDRGGV